MATQPEHSQALDQLQREVNFILEQTGRIFKSAHESNRSATLARASRLKQTLPVANVRFHEALDTLEQELQSARAVLRRDLAVAREQGGKQAATAGSASVATAAQPAKDQVKTEPASKESPPPTEVPEPPAPKKEPAASSKPPAELKVEQAKSPKKRPSPQPDEEPPAKRQAMGEEKPIKVNVNVPEVKPSETAHQADTPPPPTDETKDPHESEEKPPDTATFSNAGDLDSLFNDGASVGGAGGGDSGGEQNTSTGPDTGLDFDFATFNAGLEANNNENDNDNDNISALLPGLQDYANNSAGGEPDFSALFANDPLTTGGGGDASNGTGDGQQQQRDTTFDDLMGDLTFTMDGDGNDGGNDIFDFS